MSDAHLTCQEVVEIVTDYLEGRMPADDVATVEAHLELCPGCVFYVEQMRALLRIGAADREPELERLAERLLPAFRSLRRGLT